MEDGFKLREEWMESQRRAEQSFRRCYQDIDRFCDAETAYQVAKSQAIVSLIEDGKYSQTTVSNMVKGLPEVVQALRIRMYEEENLRTDREAAKYWANVEAHRFKEYEMASKEAIR